MKKHKNLLYIIYYLAWCFAAVMVPQYLIGLIGQYVLKLNLGQPLPNLIYTILAYALSIWLILWVPYKIFKQKKVQREELGLDGVPKWIDLVLAPAGFVVFLALSTIVAMLCSKIPGFDASEAQNLGVEAVNLRSGGERVLVYVALAIVAPVAEEVIFRGWLYAKLRAKIKGKGSLALSIILSSLLFALLHGQWNVGVNVFCLAVVLCGLREATGTIYAGITLHILKNTIAFFLVYMI